VRNAMTNSRVATRKSSGRVPSDTIQKLPVIRFPNDWTATSPSNSRYRKRCETRNGGGAGGAETIRAAPTDAPVQRDFVPSFACHSMRRVLGIGGAPGTTRTESADHSRALLWWPSPREPSATSREEGLEQIQDWCHAFRVEPGRGRRDADSNGKRTRRERSEQRLVGPIVANREDEVPRFSREFHRKVAALVHPGTADLDDLVPRQDLKIEVCGQRGQDVDEVLCREGSGFYIRRAAVPRDRDVFLFERRPGDTVEESLHDVAPPARRPPR